MNDQKVFVGSIEHEWSSPFKYVIGTSQSEVDEFLKESSMLQSYAIFNDCVEDSYCQYIGILNWSENMTVFEDYRGVDIPLDDNGEPIIKGETPEVWIGIPETNHAIALFRLDMFSTAEWNLDRSYEGCVCSSGMDLSYGYIETDNVEQILDYMNDNQVIKIGDLELPSRLND